ncbi:hypothetical protein [Methylibium sp.]|uniref:hypothetical protein n=1 Tax=Methylibium sp. TaxID=2067992 RepID=UPI00286C6694|nr:hypothetical protein [Methylibium sp.]
MPSPLIRHCCWSLDDLSSADVQSLLAVARALKHAGGVSRPLQGRHVAVLCEALHSASADVFSAAAARLGAVVVRIPPSVLRLAERQGLRELANTLGRLYGAIECDGPSDATAEQLAGWAGVPVFNAVAARLHPTRLLADLLTMCEHAQQPAADVTLCMASHAGSPLAAAWCQLGALTGVGMRSCEPAAGASLRSGDFVFEAQRSGGVVAPPALLAMEDGHGQRRSLLDQQAENHRYVVQALLSSHVN